MKRLNARLGAAVAALLITISCGIPVARAAQSRAQVTLHMWGWADRNLCAQDYEKAHSGVKVAYTEVSDYITKLNVLRRAGGSGMPDVYFGDVEEAANIYHLGLTTDLSQIVPSFVKAKYAPGTLGLV